MNTIEHKGIKGTVEFDQESKMFFGKLIGINGVVLYEGTEASEFNTNFLSAVEEYIALCKEYEIPLKKEFKGVFDVRTSPEIHESLHFISLNTVLKINTIVNQALNSFLQNVGSSATINEADSEIDISPKKKESRKITVKD
ncbi:type II toxin-antitoxin system HicB family antitoxin [Chryseobacterium sp. MP_3.2]|uniref:type II toxin-antitoxin system HicB family antitoxin n=1 Tax=Chryseobacterium sp. MP_3.2 TaxID=3071712 RepID=UPI002E09592C|nr:putative HicB family RNase H-like nuclease [Chryseobacterium sp. MP_3.2]